MDPASAVGVAAAILAFSQTAMNLVIRFNTLRKPGLDAESEVAAKIQGSQILLEQLAPDPDRPAATTAEKELERLYKAAQTVVENLGKLHRRTSGSLGDGRMTTLKKVVVGLTKQKELEELQQSICFLQQQINSWRLVRVEDGIASLLDANRKTQHALQEAVGILSHPSHLPRQMGYFWERGEMSEHVLVDDGMGQSFYLPWSLCSSPEQFHSVLVCRYDSGPLPGRRQILEGHLEAWHWDETRMIDSEEWPRLAKGGRIKLAFIMGHIHMCPPDRCMRCRKPFALMRGKAKSDLFRTCTSCKLSLRRVVCEYDYEPVDANIDNPYALRDFKRSGHEGYTPPDSKDTSESDPHPSGGPVGELDNENISSDEPSVDLVCRRLTMQWSPIWNFVFRYYYCRCIIWRSLPLFAKHLPPGLEEQTILRYGTCPRHSTGATYTGFDYGDVGYEQDDYFLPFGGVAAFRGVTAGQLKAENGSVWEQLGGAAYTTHNDLSQGIRFLESLEEQKASAFCMWADCYVQGRDDGTPLLDPIMPRMEDVPGLLSFSAVYFWKEWGIDWKTGRNAVSPKPHPELPRNSGMFYEVDEILRGRGPRRPHWSTYMS